MLDAILFDLDGTLLPMDNDYFTKVYFGHLAKAAENWGYNDKEKLIAGVWSGVKAMVKNDGSRFNVDAFWDTFSQVIQRDCSGDIEKFDAFYENEFHNAKAATGEAPLAATAVTEARKKAKKVILATNPIFPEVATASRLSWIGLKIEDFDYVTNYSNSRFCKPNPMYYKEIMDKFGLDGENCLMIGNDVQEDCASIKTLGAKCFLVTDFIINRSEEKIDCACGSYSEMIEYIKSL